jgi:hypothetical protein
MVMHDTVVSETRSVRCPSLRQSQLTASLELSEWRPHPFLDTAGGDFHGNEAEILG